MRGYVPLVLMAGLVVALARPAGADTRPRIAVLGLEVTSAVDVRTTELAHELTEGMRARARLGSGPYAYAPSSERELIDEKLIKQCDNEGLGCMSEIGKELDADVIIYGKLEKTDKVVRMSLHLLDVVKKSKINRTSTTVPLSSSKEEVKIAARKAYEELAGAAAAGGAGTVEVETNVQTGTVYVDDSSSEVLENGKATLTLPEGRYRIAVESPGRRRKEITVTVKSEQVITQQFELIEGSTVVRSSSTRGWRTAFFVTGGVGAGFGLYSLFQFLSWRGDVNNIRAAKTDEMGEDIDAGDCDGGSVRSGVNDIGGVLAGICAARQRNIYSAAIAIVLIAPTAYFGYRAFFAKKGESRTMAFTPVITPKTAGAAFEVKF